MKNDREQNRKRYGLSSSPFFVLAPMDDVTDVSFRQVIAECAPPDMFYTEFANVDALQSAGRENTLRRLRMNKYDKPLVLQIWGKDPENFRLTAQQVIDGTLAKEVNAPKGINFAGIDLNMGCPAKSEVKNGTCSALIKPELRERAQAIISATQEGADGKVPVSVKTRLGFNEVDWTWTEFLLQQNLSMLTMHGRTKKQMSKVPADWEAIGKVRGLRDEIAPETLVVGNGDVLSYEQGVELADKYELDGIMIGRGVFQDPFVFAKDSPFESMSVKEKKQLYAQHVRLFDEAWQGTKPIKILNKFCKVYISGFDGAKELRDKLMRTKTADEILELLEN